MSSAPSSLASDVRALTDQLARLTLRVSALEARLGEEDEIGSAVLVEEAPGAFWEESASTLTGSAAESDPLPGASPGISRSQTGGIPLLPADRGAFADELGDWILRALQGGHRGPSGRDRLQLRSRVYVIYSDSEGRPLEVALVCRCLRDLRNRFPAVNNPGNLVFPGFPSEWEARRATGRTGVRWPDA